MSEELRQRNLLDKPEKIGKWDFYNIGSTSVKALKGHNIIRNIDYKGVERKKVDALIVYNKNVIAVIENKIPAQFKTEKQKNKAIEQEIEVARKLGAKIIIASDTKESIWVNVDTGNRIIDEDGTELKTVFDKDDDKLPELIEKIKNSINGLNDQIKPKNLVNPTDLAKSIWQDVWSVSGATPENCLYTFVELFIFKYLSDLGVLQGIYNFHTLTDSFQSNTEDEILDTYASVIRPKIKTLFPENLIDKTTIINGTIFVSKDQKAVKGYSSVFKKVLLKFKAYGKLEYIHHDFKSQLFESFLKESISTKNWGQYFTPLKVVRGIVEMAKDEIKEGIKICDPACGVGKFLLEPLLTKIDRFYKIEKGELIPNITIHGFDKGFDKDEQKTIILAKANMLIYFSDLLKENKGITPEFANLFNNSFLLKTNSILGTLANPVESEYDLILTNPPYVMSGSGNLKQEIKKDGDLVDHYRVNALGLEGLFMEWIVRALKPNGKAFIVIPEGILDRRNDKHLRSFLLETCFIDGIISLPENTFFSTPKKTCILSITKKSNIKEVQTDPVFSYIVSEIGESRDVYRFDTEQDDLSEAVTLYSFFKGNKKNFKKIVSDKRCKIIDFQYFEDNVENDWIVDKLWTKEEKIELKILEAENNISFSALPFLLDDISNNILSLKNELASLSYEDSESKDSFKFKSFVLDDIFTFPSIKGLTKTFVKQNSGVIPVYGGSQNETPFGLVKDNLSNVKYFKNCLAWNREGSVGYVFWHKHKFSTNDHHRPFIVKQEYKDLINLEYMRNIVQETLLAQGFKWSKTASKEKVRKISVNIPINNNGDIDIETQNQLAERYIKINSIKESIEKELSKISNVNILVKG